MALKFEITGDNSNVLSSLDGVRTGVRRTAKEVEQQGMGIEDMFKRIGEAAGVAFSLDMAKRFVDTIMSVRGQFQQLEIAFSTMLQSEEKANALMKQLVDTAAKTPFDLKGVAEGAKQLLAYGTAAEDINETITRLGDIAAGLSIPLGDLVYLFGTTMTQGRMFTMDLRQFMGRGIPMAEELAKQFGVTKNEVAGLVTAGKVSAEAVKKAIWSMTEEGSKFGGLMAKQSASITGQISNIEDAIDEMFNEMGKKSEEAINAGLSGVSLLVENWETVGKAILAAAETFGIYKATLMGMTAYNSAATNIAYDAEIASLSKLLPLKEEEMNVDLRIAVAEGRLSQSKAEMIASMRAELSEQLRVLAAKEAAATANYKIALEEHLLAQRNMAVAQSQVKIALETGTAEEIAAAKRGAATAKLELQNAAIAKNTAHKELNAIATQREALANGLDAASSAGATASTGLLTQAKLALKRAVDAVNKSFLASPLFWIAATITAVTFAVYKLATAESEHERAVRKANEAIDEQDKKISERKDEIDKLVRTIQDETATEYEKVKAYNKLKNIAPQITEEYSRQELAAMKAAESQTKFNESLENMEVNDVKKHIAELQQNIGGFDQTLQKALANSGGGQGAAAISEMAYEQLRQWEEELKIYQAKLNEMELARKQAADEARPIEIRIKEAQENVDAMQSIHDFYEKAMDLAEHFQEANDEINYVTAQNNVDEFIQTSEAELADMKRQIEENPTDYKLQLEYEEKQKILNGIIDMKNQMKASGATTIPLFFKMDYQSFQNAWNAVNNQLQTLVGQTAGGGATTLLQDFTAAQKRYQAALKNLANMEANRAKYTKAQYEEAKTELKDAKKGYEDLGGDTSNRSAKKAASAAKSAKKEADRKAKEEADRQARERAEAMKHEDEMVKLGQEAERAKADARIAAIRFNSQREQAEREEQFKREEEDVKRQADEVYKNIYEQRKRAYENTNKDKKYENDEVGQNGWKALISNSEEEARKKLNDEEFKQWKLVQDKKNAELKKINSQRERTELDYQKQQIDSMRDYLKEYGTFQQQKLAIAQEYAEKIAEAEGAGNRGEVMRLKAERDSQVATANAKALAMDIDWNQTFSGLGNVLEEIAKDTLDKVNQYMETADFKGLAADAKQAYQDLKKQLIDAGGQKASNPFSKGMWDEIGKLTTQYKTKVKALADASEKHAKDTEKYNKALDTEVKAQEKLAKAKEDQANHAGDEKYERAVEEANLDLADASAKAKNALEEWMDSGEEVKNQQQGVYDTQQKLGQATDSAEQGLNNFNTVVSQLTSGTLVGFADGIANIIMAITKSGDQMEGIGGLFGEAGKQIGGIVGAILSIIDMLGTDPAKFITDILDKISQVIEAIISNIPQIIGAIIQGIGNIIAGVFKGLGSLFGLDIGGKDNHEEMLKRQKEYTRSIESSSRALEKFTTELERSYGIVAMQNAKKGEEIIRKNMESIVNGIDSVLSDNYGGGHSDYYHVNKQQDVLQGILRYGQANGIKAGSVGSWQDLLTMNTSEALAKTFKVISESGDDLWRKITTMGYNEGALEEWIEKLIDAYDQIDENNKQLMEQLTTTTADNVYDDFLNSLYDLADGSEDVTKNIAEDWQKMVNRMVVNNLIGGKMREELEAWYKELYDLQTARSEGRITNYSYEVSLNELQKKYNEIIENGKSQVQQFTEDGIIKPISEATDEVKKYFEDLRDSWASTLTDMTATTEDWKNELIDQVLSDLVESTILNAPLAVMVDGAEKQFDDFKKYLEDWTGRYKAIIEDQTLTDEERTARLKSMIQEQTDVREVQAERSRALAEGIGKDMKEAFSNSLDNLGDTLLDALLNTEKDAESMGREIASTLIKEMLQTMLASEKYSSEIAKIKEKWQQVLTGKNTDEEGNILFTMDDVLQQVSDLNDTIANDEAIKSLAGQYQELNKQIKNTDSLFGSIKDTFASSMMDMNKTADEMASDIGQTIAKNIIEQMVVSSAVKPLVDNLQKAFDAANVEGATYSSVIGDEAVQNALAELKNAFPGLQETAKGIMTGLGVKMNETAKQGFSDLKGTFINTLTDMDADAETLGKNLGKSMMEQMLNAMVEKEYKDDLKKINDEWADALEAGDPARLEAIKQKAEDLFATIENDQSIKKLADEIKSLTDSTSASPFDNLRSSFLSALTDMSKSTADFTKDISTMIAQSFVDSFVMGDLFDEKLAKWKKKYKEITTDSSLSEEQRMKQLKGLSELIAGERDAMKDEVNDIYKMLGIREGQDQSATMNMAEAATYDQFELYLGMETSHLMVAEETKGLVAQVLSTLQGMSSLTNPSQNYGEQIFMRLGTTNEYLLAVKKAAEGIRAEFALKLDLMNSHLSKL